MAPSQARPVDRQDLTRAVRAVATHFGTEQVFVVGSQALLVGRPDIERSLRGSQEFDIYPANAKAWEATHPERVEASEEIFALFGPSSDFHMAHGFYIDGVDERTATLAPDWRSRAVRLDVPLFDGRIAEAVAPEPNDLVAAKLVRGIPRTSHSLASA